MTQGQINVTGTPTDDMQVLGYSNAAVLYWDYSNTQCFYYRVLPNTVYRVSPSYAYQLMTTPPGLNTVYNPFGTAYQLPGSTIV